MSFRRLRKAFRFKCSAGDFSPAAVSLPFWVPHSSYLRVGLCTPLARAPFRVLGQAWKNRTLESEGCGTQRMRQYLAAAGHRSRGFAAAFVAQGAATRFSVAGPGAFRRTLGVIPRSAATRDLLLFFRVRPCKGSSFSTRTFMGWLNRQRLEAGFLGLAIPELISNSLYSCAASSTPLRVVLRSSASSTFVALGARSC
jgi:hypothetical protein